MGGQNLWWVKIFGNDANADIGNNADDNTKDDEDANDDNDTNAEDH